MEENNNIQSSNREIEEEILERTEDEEPRCKKQKRNRTIFTFHQLHSLEGLFEVNEYPDKLMRENIATDLNVTEKKINNWFQNRRAKLRKQINKKPVPSLSFCSNAAAYIPSPAPTATYIPSTAPTAVTTPVQFIQPNTNSPWSPLCSPFITFNGLQPGPGFTGTQFPFSNNSVQNILELTPPPSVTSFV